MPPKADTNDSHRQSAPTPVTGKLLIIGILAVALAAAGASWWFRYRTTHRALEFWGPEAAVLIRDAPIVTLFRKPSAQIMRLAEDSPARACFDESAYDLSQAHGIVHLRNALLDDRSFDWSDKDEKLPNMADSFYWLLSFHDRTNNKPALVILSKDCRYASRHKTQFAGRILVSVSTEPIAEGLLKLFNEQTAKPVVDTQTPHR